MTHAFDQAYFNGGGKVGGYAHEGYWDYPVHWTIFDKVMQGFQPASVLELGCARGYVLKRLKDAGVRVRGLEISEHCRLTRVVDEIETWDITKTPWPIEDGAFDLCLSVAVLEHIPEDKLTAVMREMKRTCKRGLHGIDVHDDDHFDQTHVTIRDLDFWKRKLPKGHAARDKEELVAGEIAIPPGAPGVKLNLGSFTTMFHRGWRNIDALDLSAWAQRYGYRFSQLDLRQPLPFDDGVVDLIYCSHMLEHLSYDEGLSFLIECRRVMKRGAVMRILVPDGRLVTHDMDRFEEICPALKQRPTQLAKMHELLMSGHLSLYDRDTLRHSLSAAGFVTIEGFGLGRSRSEVMLRETHDMFPDLSLIVEVEK